MNSVLLIAKREYRQIARMQSFWLTLILVPLFIIGGPIIAKILGDDQPKNVVIVDQSGQGNDKIIRERFDLENQRYVMTEVKRYLSRHKEFSVIENQDWQQNAFTLEDARRFRDGSGLKKVVAQIEQVRKKDTPSLVLSNPIFNLKSSSENLKNSANWQEFESKAHQEIQNSPANGRNELMIYFSQNYPVDQVVNFVSKQAVDDEIIDIVRQELSDKLRRQKLEQKGVVAQEVEAIEKSSPNLVISLGNTDKNKRDMLVRSSTPLILSFILFIGLTLSGNWMLQGSTEERSNKLIEGLLACTKAENLMYGKLLGTVAIGFTIFACWGLGIAVATYGIPSILSDYLRPALASLSDVNEILIIAYFFVMGYIAVSAIFMMIGAVSETMNDAQGYLMPVMFLLMGPLMVIQKSVIESNVPAWGEALTWVPLWTPFMILARLGSGVSQVEVIGGGLLLAAFVALEIFVLGKIFRNSILEQGQEKIWKKLAKAIRN